MTDEIQQEKSSLTARAFWLMFARTVAFALSFMLPLIIVRRLDQTEFGLYKQTFLVVLTSISILPLGFHMSAFYFLPREPARQGQVVLNILLFHLFVASVACAVFIVWPGILGRIFSEGHLVTHAPLIGVVILLWVGSSFLEYVPVANEDMKAATVFIVSMQVSRTLLMLGAAVFFASVRALIVAAIVQGAIQLVVAIGYLQSRFKLFASRFDWSMMRSQASYAIPLGVAGLVYALKMDVHHYFVSNRFNAATYAIYAIGCFQLPLIHILSDSVGSVMISRVTVLQKTDDKREIIHLTARMMRKLAMIYFALYAFLLVAGREFITTLFTEIYAAAWPIFAINLTMILLYFISNAYDPIMRAYAEHRYYLLRIRTLLLALLVITLWVLPVRLGMVWIIVAAVGVNMLERLMTAAKAASILKVKWRDIFLLKDVGKIAMAAMIAAITTQVARVFTSGSRSIVVLAVCGMVFAIVYSSIVLAAGVITNDEWNLVRKQLARLRGIMLWRRVADSSI